MPTDQPDASDLRERVADLEATVSDQQETIQQLMPSRRQALVGAGLLGGGLLGGRLSTGTARAQAAGQVGTDTDPVDVQAWDLDVQNGVTSDLPMGGNDVTDVGALDVEEASIGGQRSDDHWELIERINTSETISKNVDTSAYSSDTDLIKIRFRQIVDGSEISLRINDYTGDDYSFTRQEGSTQASYGNETEFKLALETGSSHGYLGEWIIGSPRSRPIIFGNGYGSLVSSPRFLIHGELDSSQALNSIQFASTETTQSFVVDVLGRS